jgi:hypothetical protein
MGWTVAYGIACWWCLLRCADLYSFTVEQQERVERLKQMLLEAHTEEAGDDEFYQGLDEPDYWNRSEN